MPTSNPPPEGQAAPTERSKESGRNSLVAVSEAWEGPLPSPEALEAFNGVVADGAARIFKEWESEAEHRRRYERKALVLTGVERIGSRVLAFVLAIAMVALAAYCAAINQPWVAAIIGGGTLGTVVIGMISGRRD